MALVIDADHATPYWLAKVQLQPALEDQSRANGRLIAAAPELLEALKDLIENPAYRVMIGGNPNATDKLYSRCLRAIAKAEGRDA